MEIASRTTQISASSKKNLKVLSLISDKTHTISCNRIVLAFLKLNLSVFHLLVLLCECFMNGRAVSRIRNDALSGLLSLEKARWERLAAPNAACHDYLLLLAPTYEIPPMPFGKPNKNCQEYQANVDPQKRQKRPAANGSQPNAIKNAVDQGADEHVGRSDKDCHYQEE